jgi:phage-related protein
MRKKGKGKYFLVIIIWFLIFLYGFIKINISKSELVKDKSRFTISFKLKPADFRIETKGYVFYINNKLTYNIKEKCISAKEKCIGVYNGIFSK